MCRESPHVIKTERAWQEVQKAPKIIYTRRTDGGKKWRGKQLRVRHNKQTEIILQVPVCQRQCYNCLPELGSNFMKGYLPVGCRWKVRGWTVILVFWFSRHRLLRLLFWSGVVFALLRQSKKESTNMLKTQAQQFPHSKYSWNTKYNTLRQIANNWYVIVLWED